jgi:hypothetical protein
VLPPATSKCLAQGCLGPKSCASIWPFHATLSQMRALSRVPGGAPGASGCLKMLQACLKVSTAPVGPKGAKVGGRAWAGLLSWGLGCVATMSHGVGPQGGWQGLGRAAELGTGGVGTMSHGAGPQGWLAMLGAWGGGAPQRPTHATPGQHAHPQASKAQVQRCHPPPEQGFQARVSKPQQLCQHSTFSCCFEQNVTFQGCLKGV